MVEDDQVAAPVAGLSLRRLHDLKAWQMDAVSAAFSRHMSGQEPRKSGAFLEGFLSGGSEVILQDLPLLQLMDAWICELEEQDFIESLPLLRRSLSGFDGVSRRRLLERIKQGQKHAAQESAPGVDDNPAFLEALPLLYQILGIEPGGRA